MAQLALNSVRKSFGAVEILKGVTLQIEAGELVVFVGPSGCGKSTLLRLIAGLDEVTEGTVEIAGEVVNDVPAAKRRLAMVFQSYALYPHMTVYKNMAFGLRMAGMDRREIDRRVREAAEMLQLTPLLDRLPKQLSGGQRQRVAIGRAITRDPAVFLFDEPLSNLDAALRVATRVEIARLHERMPGATMIYVTHDQVEAMTLADRIVVMNAGRIEQVGAPMELYHRPGNRFVAQFIGSPAMNIVPVKAEHGCLELAGGGRFSFRTESGQPQPVEVGIRPEDLRVCSPEEALLSGTVSLVERLGEVALVHLETAGAPVVAKLPGEEEIARGQALSLKAKANSRIHLFDAAGVRIPAPAEPDTSAASSEATARPPAEASLPEPPLQQVRHEALPAHGRLRPAGGPTELPGLRLM
jgi:ABC-type sugar transport system ATPase subunit